MSDILFSVIVEARDELCGEPFLQVFLVEASSLDEAAEIIAAHLERDGATFVAVEPDGSGAVQRGKVPADEFNQPGPPIWGRSGRIYWTDEVEE